MLGSVRPCMVRLPAVISSGALEALSGWRNLILRAVTFSSGALAGLADASDARCPEISGVDDDDLPPNLGNLKGHLRWVSDICLVEIHFDIRSVTRGGVGYADKPIYEPGASNLMQAELVK